MCLLLSLGLLWTGAACSSSNPVEPAPDGTGGGGTSGGDGSGSFQIALSLTPQDVPVDGSATLTLKVTNRATGQAPANGSEVMLNTDLGYFSLNASNKEVQTAVVELLGGAGQTAFFGGDSTGTAELLALFDDSSASLNIDIVEPDEPRFLISSVSPSVGSGQGGETVTLTGVGFTEPLQVTFDGAAAVVGSVASSEVTVTTPPAVPALANGESRRVDVVVSIDIDTSTPRSSTLPGGYIYSQGGGPLSQPAIFSVDPTQGPNEGGTTVTFTGQGFESNARVFFGFAGAGNSFDGVEATVTSAPNAGGTSMQVSTPAATGSGQALLNKTVDIQVENPRTGSTAVLPLAFRYGAGSGSGAIVVSAISPRQAPYTGLASDGSATTITLLGQGFGTAGNGNLRVSLAGVAQGTPTVVADSELQFTLAAAAVANCAPPSGPAVVTNVVTGESGTTDFDFTYTVDAPQLSGLSPTSGSESGGTTVTVSGSALLGSGATSEAVRVTFDGVRGTVNSVSSTAVGVTTPAFTGTFDTADCDDNGDGVTGTRSVATAVDVAFTNLASGCADSLPRSFTYTPDDTSCQETTRLDASFTFTTSDLTASFTDTSSGSPVEWAWDFGDGDTSPAQNPNHTYDAAGSYQVTLQVTNADGAKDQVTQTVTVSDPPPPPP